MPPTPAKFMKLSPKQAWELLWNRMKLPPQEWHPEPFDWAPESKAVIAAIERMKIGKTFTAVELRLRVKNARRVSGVLEEAMRYGIVDYTGIARTGGRLYRRVK